MKTEVLLSLASLLLAIKSARLLLQYFPQASGTDDSKLFFHLCVYKLAAIFAFCTKAVASKCWVVKRPSA